MDKYIHRKEWDFIGEELLNWVVDKVIVSNYNNMSLDLPVLIAHTLRLILLQYGYITLDIFKERFFYLYQNHAFFYVLNYPKMNHQHLGALSHKENQLTQSIFTQIYQDNV